MALWFAILCQVSVIAFGLVAGVFLAFSDFIMRSLDKATAPAGVEVMQAINREVFRYVFMPLFLGMAAVSLVILGYAYLSLTGPAAVLSMFAAGLYLVGVFGVTVVFNVPLNNRLAALDHRSAEVLSFWSGTYRPRWTAWNSIRTIASAAAAACLLSALIWSAQG